MTARPISSVSRPAIITFLKWAGLTSLCLSIGFSLALTSPDLGFTSDIVLFYMAVFTVMGTLQWAVVLRRNLDNVTMWIWASGFAWIVFMLSSVAVSQTVRTILHGVGFDGSDPISLGVGNIIFGAILGFSMGVLQWLVIRRKLRNATWWLRGNILGYGLGYAVILQMDKLGSPQRDAIMPGPINIPVTLTGAVLGSIIIGVITGVTMVYLLRERL